ncbi:MAG: hypothetical protein IJC30_03435 [Alphaproteobacteria bacterium]|nr:hypothetical protein [Alphaproteobacteria bacterium]
MKDFIRFIITVTVLIVFTGILLYLKPKQRASTARVDVKSVISSDEKKLRVYAFGREEMKADWTSGTDVYAIHTENKKFSFSIYAISDCDTVLLLRGPYDVYGDLSHKKLWVKYVSVRINGEEILGKNVDAWHDEPYQYTFSAQKGNTYNIEVNWK